MLGGRFSVHQGLGFKIRDRRVEVQIGVREGMTITGVQQGFEVRGGGGGEERGGGGALR